MTDKPEAVWSRVCPPEAQANIIEGSVNLAMSLSAHFDLSPEKVGGLLANLDDSTANAIAYLYGPADGKIVKAVGETLRGEK